MPSSKALGTLGLRAEEQLGVSIRKWQRVTTTGKAGEEGVSSQEVPFGELLHVFCIDSSGLGGVEVKTSR